MSDTSESPAVPPTSPPKPDHKEDERDIPTHQPSTDLVKDIVLWRRKRLNGALLSAATTIWMMMEVFQYNFIPLFSYTAMALLLLLFLWGSTHRLLQKEAPDLSRLDVSEETAVETARMLRRKVEEGVRMVFHVSVEREWFVLAGVVAVLFLLSLVGSYLDLLTLCYLGLVGGLTVPMVYMRNEQRIREWVGKLRIRSQSLYAMTRDKMLQLKNMIAGRRKEVKMKKIE